MDDRQKVDDGRWDPDGETVPFCKVHMSAPFIMPTPSRGSSDRRTFVCTTTMNCDVKKPQLPDSNKRPPLHVPGGASSNHLVRTLHTVVFSRESAPDAWAQQEDLLHTIEHGFKNSRRKRNPSVMDILLSWCTCTDHERLDMMAWHGVHDLVQLDSRSGKIVA